MPNPACSQDCNAALPPAKFSNCNPNVNFSEIRRIFMAKLNAAPFNNWKAAGEWNTRVNNTTTTGNDYIREFTVIGDKPAAANVVAQISNGRTKVIGKDHTLNFTIDDVTDENYEAMRAFECGGKYRFWYETEGGYMFGGNEGFTADMVQNSVLDRGREAYERIEGVLTWRSKFHPERAVSPIYDGDSGTTPTTFDNTMVIETGETDNTIEGVTMTVSAQDPEQAFEFNTVTPRTGTPVSMTIEVSGVEEAVIDYTTDYGGLPFRYTDKAGVEHTGNFLSATGTVEF
jgi:hypothetical protein